MQEALSRYQRATSAPLRIRLVTASADLRAEAVAQFREKSAAGALDPRGVLLLASTSQGGVALVAGAESGHAELPWQTMMVRTARFSPLKLQRSLVEVIDGLAELLAGALPRGRPAREPGGGRDRIRALRFAVHRTSGGGEFRLPGCWFGRRFNRAPSWCQMGALSPRGVWVSMQSRIEIAEIVAFRLKVGRKDLALLPEELASELRLTLEENGAELQLSTESGDCHLRFRSIGTDAVLTEIAIVNDAKGLFFQKVLGALMVKHGGDLHARVSWNVPEWNTHGDHAEIRISKGATTYPGLGKNQLLPSPDTHAALGGAGPKAAEADDEGPLPPELSEVAELLAKAKHHWDEYQRLKANRSEHSPK